MSQKDKKEQVRQKLLEIRRRMTETDYQDYSGRIISRVKKLECFKISEVIHCYVSINERREVNTHPLIKELLSGSKKVVVPVMQMKEGGLNHIQLNRFSDLEPNRWNVPEPSAGKETPVEKLDLILVPMVGGDDQKNRIGYGGGFYDRFLKNVPCPSIGLLFDECLIDRIPAEPFDVPLTKIVTQKQIIS
jgi:5-formyltetrahydrofolate cyclo-ligase